MECRYEQERPTLAPRSAYGETGHDDGAPGNVANLRASEDFVTQIGNGASSASRPTSTAHYPAPLDFALTSHPLRTYFALRLPGCEVGGGMGL
jgi:hypothetical protein